MKDLAQQYRQLIDRLITVSGGLERRGDAASRAVGAELLEAAADMSETLERLSSSRPGLREPVEATVARFLRATARLDRGLRRLNERAARWPGTRES